MLIWEDYSNIQDKLLELNKYLAELSRTSFLDYQTGLYNRRYIDNRIDEEIQRAQRYQHFLSLVAIQLVDKKESEQESQEEPVDYMTEKLSGLLKDKMRKMDIPSRYDDRTFFILLPETSGEGGQKVASRLKRDFEEFLYGKPMGANKGVVIGVGTYPSDARTSKELVEKVITKINPGN